MSLKRDILIVDDNYEICEFVKDVLDEEGYNVAVAYNTKMALESVVKMCPDLIILDMWLEGNHMDGIGLLKKLKQMFPDVPIIMISGHANVELAASTMKLGAYDFIEKPFKTEKLLIVVKRAIETSDLLEVNSYLQQNAGGSMQKVCLGSSKNAQKLRHEIRSVADSNCRLIITGEYGSQLSQVAKEIHDASHRASKPFISLNTFCTNSNNIYEAINGSDDVQSIFERANGGTIVLENLHTIPLMLQNKILDVLQKESITRAGKNIKLDVRLIGAFELNDEIDDIEQLVSHKLLNEVLYHRLNIKRISVPPLRQRIDDIMVLFTHGINILNNHLAPITIHDKLHHILISYDWPGNTYELYHVAEYMVMMARLNKSTVVSMDTLPQHILNQIKEDFGALDNITKFLDKDYKSARKHFDMEYINAQLRKFSNNVARTARFMGVDRAALYRKIRALSVQKINKSLRKRMAKKVYIVNSKENIHEENNSDV